jgi:hypothetical protein
LRQVWSEGETSPFLLFLLLVEIRFICSGGFDSEIENEIKKEKR